MTREEIKHASKDYVNYLLDKQEYHNEKYTEHDIKQAFEKGAEWADAHPKNVWHDPSKEIKELIIQCVDKCTEYEIHPKDIFNEIYKYIDKWYKDEN